MFVVVNVMSCVEGVELVLHGPFDTKEEAIRYGEYMFEYRSQWVVKKLVKDDIVVELAEAERR